MMRVLLSVFLLLFLGLVIAFCLQNGESIKLTLLAWSFGVPVCFVALVAYVLGTLPDGPSAGF
jgi:uncharacterized integral membrane protein